MGGVSIDNRNTIDWRGALEAAWERRHSVAARATFADDCEAYRLLHGWSEGIFGLEIDRYGEVALIRGKQEYNDALPAIAEALEALHPWQAILAKPWRGSAPEALSGELPADPVVVKEHGLRFAVELSQPANPGLHLDARVARRWLASSDRCVDRRVLNLFAFTGSLGVAAMAGGARVVHIDSQRGALTRCARNHELNGQRVDQRDLLRGNIFQHLKRSRKRQRFGGIICDPPPYPAGTKTPTAPKRLESVAGLASLTAPLLEERGWLMLLFHDHGRSHDEHEAEAIAGAASSAVTLVAKERFVSDDDYPADTPDHQLRVSVLERR